MCTGTSSVLKHLGLCLWVDRFGRIAFSRPGAELKQVEADSLAAGHSVLTPFVSLDTPGKASVQVVILADPDGHEVRIVRP